MYWRWDEPSLTAGPVLVLTQLSKRPRVGVTIAQRRKQTKHPLLDEVINKGGLSTHWNVIHPSQGRRL